MGVVLLALFTIPRFTDSNRGLVSAWSSAGIDCLVNGHTRTAQHFHPLLTIVVDGRAESIPASTGVIPSCMAEVHTHDASGTIHVESASGDKKFYLKDFFTIYGRSIDRDGHTVSMKVDGAPSTELGDLLLKDKQNIVLDYTKKVQ